MLLGEEHRGSSTAAVGLDISQSTAERLYEQQQQLLLQLQRHPLHLEAQEQLLLQRQAEQSYEAFATRRQQQQEALASASSRESPLYAPPRAEAEEALTERRQLGLSTQQRHERELRQQQQQEQVEGSVQITRSGRRVTFAFNVSDVARDEEISASAAAASMAAAADSRRSRKSSGSAAQQQQQQ